MGDMPRCGVGADFKLRCSITVIALKSTSRIGKSSGTIDDIFEVFGQDSFDDSTYTIHVFM